MPYWKFEPYSALETAAFASASSGEVDDGLPEGGLGDTRKKTDQSGCVLSLSARKSAVADLR
ncbi:MAG: hypothetical protein ACLPTZ_08745, partial [Beijerinckiaceae bacterium]